MQGFAQVDKQQGTVLITVLLVVSVVVLLIVDVNKTVNYQAQLNRNLMHRDQAYSYLMGMEELAKIYLKKAFEDEKEDKVHLGQAWAEQDIVFPFDGGSMSATIIDMQSCFNLNSIGLLSSNGASSGRGNGEDEGDVDLVSEKENPINRGLNGQPGEDKGSTGELIFTTLLEKVLDNSDVSPAALAAATRDWIDVDTTPNGPDGVEDNYYQGLDVPYLPPNGPIAHPSELRTVKQFDKNSYAQVRPYVCVLPDGEDNKLNVNTLTPQKSVLLYAALGGKLSQEAVNKLISNRPEKGYDMQEFWQEVGTEIKIKKALKERIDVTSRFFQMKAKAEMNNTKVYIKSLFIKEDNNNFKVVSRYFGKE